MYILFECSECNKLIAYPERTSDGRMCNCGGCLIPTDNGTIGYLSSKHKRPISFPSRRKEKPPLGLQPEYVWNEQRIQEIKMAIHRYMMAGKSIPNEWIEEYNRRAR